MKYIKKTTWLPVLCLALSSSVWADDASDAIEKAAALYKEGQTQQAITQLEFSATPCLVLHPRAARYKWSMASKPFSKTTA
ncbi:MAG: hypothetical protein QJT81_09210 [Candidatus Thiothrix putei]|uniref:Tetratricopeptide repeat protein n=1 Tax=Candidatus Thiothrix putei TaxID=3080811 RepID=A0AA95HL40_9GAMM|nr:MAG: hypothetical protein QJT81_09210 [Candidatus Thiothrix putei]